MADYAAALLGGVAPPRDVSRWRRARCDVALYHLGNNALHAAIYRRALERPGVVVLHDAVLHHFLLGQLDEARVHRRVRLQLRRVEPRSGARTVARARAGSGADSRYFDYPMLRRVVERARAVVVHNPGRARARSASTRRRRASSRSRTCSAPPDLPGEAEDRALPRSAWACRRTRSCSACSATCGNPSG